MSDTATLQLSGDCSIRTIRTRHRELTSALDATAVLEIDCADAERIDLSFAQLITSAARTARRHAKRIRLVNLPDSGRAAFARAGLSPHESDTSVS